jgi:manganese transport protein
MIALIIFTNRADIMGPFRNNRVTRIAAVVGTTVVLVLNAVLIALSLGVPIPGLSGAQ